jgi:hypothetical protein
MPKTSFVNGSVVTPAFLNAINNPTYVDSPEFDGEIKRITNADLSNAPGEIKQEWTKFRDEFRVSVQSDLTVACTGGSITMPLGTIQVFAPGLYVVQNNALSYLFVNETGAIVSSLVYPVVGVLLAAITAVSGVITSIVDLRPRYRVQPLAAALKIFGGTGEQSDYVLSSGSATFDQGVYYFRNFTISASANLTISQFARIYCSGNVLIQGTINVSTFASGGLGFGTAVHSNIGGLSGSGPGAGSGSGIGRTYSYSATPFGSGGGSGFYSGSGSFSTAGAIVSGGDGGGGIWFEAAGLAQEPPF